MGAPRVVDGSARATGGPTTLGEGIRGLIASLGLEAKLLEAQVFLVWSGVLSDIAGEAAAKRARAGTMRRGELVVSVRQDALRHRLFFDRDRIRDGLNQAVGAKVVRSIRFTK